MDQTSAFLRGFIKGVNVLYLKINDITHNPPLPTIRVQLFLNGSNLGLFGSYPFVSNINLQKKTVDFSGIRTRIVRVEGDHVDLFILRPKFLLIFVPKAKWKERWSKLLSSRVRKQSLNSI